MTVPRVKEEMGTVGTKENRILHRVPNVPEHKRELGTANPMEKFEVPNVPSVPTKKNVILEKVCDFPLKGAHLQISNDPSNRGPNRLKVMSRAGQSIGTATKKQII